MTTVAITTSADRIEIASRPFRDRGFDPVPLPCIRIEPAGEDVLQSARDATSAADLLFITSARVVEILWPDGDMPPIRTAAVGTATARAVADAGGDVTVVGHGGGLDLIDLLRGAPSDAVVFPHAAGTARRVFEALERAAGSVSTFAVYETVPISPGPDPVDAVTFASASAVDGWFLSRGLDGTTVAAIGRPTAAALAVFGVDAHVVPDTPGFEPMAAQLSKVITT